MLYSPPISHYLIPQQSYINSPSHAASCVLPPDCLQRFWHNSNCLVQYFFTATFSLCSAIRRLQRHWDSGLRDVQFRTDTDEDIRTFNRCYSPESLWFVIITPNVLNLVIFSAKYLAIHMWRFCLAFTNLYVAFALEQKCPSVWNILSN